MAKVFVVSLHRCAGQSLALFLQNAGFATCHFPAIVDGIDYQGQVVGLETARRKVFKVLQPVFDKYDAVSDIPVPVLYRELDEAYPDARFVAIYRSPFDWVRSVRSHCRDRPLDPYERIQYWRYLDTQPRRLEEVRDDLLLQMYLQHYRRLEVYFGGRRNFLLADLNDGELGRRISSFLGIPAAEFPRFDFKDNVTHRPEVTVTALQHRLAAVETEIATLNGILRDYADLTRGAEVAQGWLIDQLGPGLLHSQQLPTPPRPAPAERHGDDSANANDRAMLARLSAVTDRANRLGLDFCSQKAGWERQRRELRRTLEGVVGARDRAFRSLRALREMPDPPPRVAMAPVAGPTAPLVSIVMPVYNQASLVEEALDGVQSQTFQNWELIVVDDGSSDDLAVRIRKRADDRRLLFLRQPNQKLPAALNHGFARARGELLTWTSADNVMLPTQLERLVEELSAHPEIGLVYSDYWAIDDAGEPLAEPRWRVHNRDQEIGDLIRLPSLVSIANFHRSGDNFIGASFLYRRAVAAIVGDFADDAFGGEDYDFWLRMHLATEFRHVAEPLYKYRVHANTLSSRATELGLDANIDEVMAADRWRVDTLLTDGDVEDGGGLLRPVRQFQAAVLKRCRVVPYRDLAAAAPTAMPLTPVVVDVDVPPRLVEPAVLQHADLLLCRSALTAAALPGAVSLRGKRVVDWTGEITPAVQHAFMQAFADRVTAPVIEPVARIPARIDDAFRPVRILLLVERWSTGGLENIVIDLADSLAATGRTVFVAGAHGAPPPAAAFAAGKIRTLCFDGSESGFDAFLRSEQIEVVNYHHSSFAAGCAKSQRIATVYTMHNCYLWMDAEARRRVATGLAGIDRLVAVSRQVAQFANAQFDFPADRIVVIPNGLRDDILNVAPLRAATSPGSPFTVAMVGSFTPLKLQHVAVAAFTEVAREIPDMRLRLIGSPADDAYGAQLRSQIVASPQAHRIELKVGLTRWDAIAELAAAHVFILPSLVEGCSMALLEAVAAGCVCIASDVGAARDLQSADGAILLLPSPLGELDAVDQQQFFAAAASDLPQHRENLAEKMRTAWREYGSLAAGVSQTRARLLDLHGMAGMTDAYLDAYTMAYRGGTCAPHAATTERQTAAGARSVVITAG